MRAIVFHGVGDIRLDNVPEPVLEASSDAIVRITASAICGTDLHMVRGTMPGMKPGTILGHEGVGVVEQIGKDVRNLSIGDRVLIPSTIACGNCSYCRAGYYSQCDKANPNGPLAGTAFFGGPAITGPFNGLQADKARVPYASVGLVKLPETVSDSQAIMLSDIFPTGFFGAEMADIHAGSTVAVFGCGPVGQFVIASAKLLRAGRIFAIDTVDSRLQMAKDQGAEAINFSEEDPVETIRNLTDGIGVDRAVDAVGVDAYRRVPGDAPAQVLQWAVQAVAKAGTISIVGVYPPSAQTFPIGAAMNKNLVIKMGNCPHRKYVARLVNMVASGVIDPEKILTQIEPLTSAIEAYQAFDQHQPGWVKVELKPQPTQAETHRT